MRKFQNKTTLKSEQRRSCERVPRSPGGALTCRGARLHDHWQQLASKRGAAKEVRFPCFRPDGDGERRARARADHSGERDEAHRGVV